MTLSNAEYKQKFIEYLILLILGDFNDKLSVLHIQKEIYLLCNFDVDLKELFSFVKHYKGPYLDLINLTAITILNRLYGSLNCEELLLLIYTEFPQYTEKSEVYSNIISKKTNIAKNLFDKKVIDEEKYNELSQI